KSFCDDSEGFSEAKSASVTTSPIFCLAKANQFLISAGSAPSSVSKSKSQGTCNKAQEGAIQIRSAPTTFSTCSITSRDEEKSFFQILRPSTSPREIFLSCFFKSEARTSSNCPAPRTKSK